MSSLKKELVQNSASQYPTDLQEAPGENSDPCNDQSDKPIDWSSKKCLLVDDNKDVLIYLNRILLDTGITVMTATIRCRGH